MPSATTCPCSRTSPTKAAAGGGGAPGLSRSADPVAQPASLVGPSTSCAFDCRPAADPVAICYLDLDRFKPVNDVYGHKAGDQLLREVARRLEHEVRAHDTVARLGGDEFVLLLTDLTSESEVEGILARVVGAMNDPFRVSPEHAVTISASIGVALFPNDGRKADVLFRHADQAMYRAKRAGWNPL